MGIDFAELDAAITYAVEHPDGFDFGFFFHRTDCGTTACLAGNIAVRAGWTPVWGSTDDDPNEASHVEKDGVRAYVKSVAAELLGLTDDQASDLFVGAGGLRGVIEVRNDLALAAGVPERTWDVPVGVW